MVKEYSPFTPGVPVPYDFFIGRKKEVEELIYKVQKSHDTKSIERIFVIGERGIGKSSLCSMAINIIDKTMPDILCLHVYLGGVTTLEEMVRRIFERLLKESVGKAWYNSVKEFLGNHIKQTGLFGISVEFDASDAKLLDRAVNDFAPALRNLLIRLQEKKESILLVLDDLMDLAESERFANWFKSLVDEVATSREKLPVTLVLVGIPDSRMKMIMNQPSLDRVFDLIEISRFSEKETKDFFLKAFGKVNIKVEKAALEELWHLSGGYPVFMHEIGNAVYETDTDNVINEQDTISGIMMAVEIIGMKYFGPKVMEFVKSKKYKNILIKIAQDFGIRFSRQEVPRSLSAEELKVFDNFINKMVKLGVVIQDKEIGRGWYRFSSELYSLFFFMQSRPLT